MTEELKGRLEALADKKSMSMNTIITAALMDYCESNGM
jgi:predicted transcriptional regulator